MGDENSERAKRVRSRAIGCEHMNRVTVPQRAKNLLIIVEIIGYWEGQPFPELAIHSA
jgi:hypothetical protein